MDVDSEDLTPYFHDIVEFMHSAMSSGGRVFVHWYAISSFKLISSRRGKSRSATFVLAYLMSKHSHNLDAALEYAKQKRSVVQPNPGFMQQLRNFESNLTKQLSSQDNNTSVTVVEEM